MNDKCSLLIEFKTYPWCNESQEYELRIDNLPEIDKYTLRYTDKNALFLSVKDKILASISSEYVEKYGIMPVDIELSDRGVYIKRNDKPIQALFQNISIGENVYSIDTLVISKMMKGALLAFYNCDKERNKSIIYDSFFVGNLRYVASRLEVGVVKESDYFYVYRSLTKMHRYPEVVRFLLSYSGTLSFDDYYQMFLDLVSEIEEIPSPFLQDGLKKEDVKGYYYRYPYKDD